MTLDLALIANAIAGKLGGTQDERLMRLYALLVLTTGEATTLENVHDAWAAWRAEANPAHKSLVPFSQLTAEVQELDRKYMLVIREIAATRKEG